MIHVRKKLVILTLLINFSFLITLTVILIRTKNIRNLESRSVDLGSVWCCKHEEPDLKPSRSASTDKGSDQGVISAGCSSTDSHTKPSMCPPKTADPRFHFNTAPAFSVFFSWPQQVAVNPGGTSQT